MSKFSKRAQKGMFGTTAKETVQDLGVQVKNLLNKLTPMMQGLQQSIPQLNAVMQKIQQLEQQVVSMEQANAKVQQATQQQASVDQNADDEIKDKLKGGEADNIPESKVNKRQLDMGQKVEMEHTDNPEIAREIARDHLSEELKDGKGKEDQTYYTDLKKMHDDSCNDVVPSLWRRNLDYGER